MCCPDHFDKYFQCTESHDENIKYEALYITSMQTLFLLSNLQEQTSHLQYLQAMEALRRLRRHLPKALLKIHYVITTRVWVSTMSP